MIARSNTDTYIYNLVYYFYRNRIQLIIIMISLVWILAGYSVPRLDLHHPLLLASSSPGLPPPRVPIPSHPSLSPIGHVCVGQF